MLFEQEGLAAQYLTHLCDNPAIGFGIGQSAAHTATFFYMVIQTQAEFIAGYPFFIYIMAT